MRFNFTVRDDNKIAESDENHAFFKDCVRFSKHKRRELNDPEIANVYVHLRKKGSAFELLIQSFLLGCDRAAAIQYCTVPHCKVDITTPRLGPSKYKELKAIVDPINLYYGWQIAGNVNYRLDDTHESYRAIVTDRDEIGLNRFFGEEKHLNAEYRQKMQHLKEFYIELNKKYCYSELPKAELYQKLKEMEEQTVRKDNQPKTFLKGKGIKFFEMVDIIAKEDESSTKGNRIVDLKAFTSILPEGEKANFQLRQKFIDKNYQRSPGIDIQQQQVSVEKRNTVLRQMTQRFELEANSSVRDLQETSIHAHELYKEEYNQSHYVSVQRKSKDNPLRDIALANTAHMQKSKFLRGKAIFEDAIQESEQDDEAPNPYSPRSPRSPYPLHQFGHIQENSNSSVFKNHTAQSFRSDFSNDTERIREKRIRFIRASQLQQQRMSKAILINESELYSGYLDFEKRLDDLAHDELSKILHPIKKAKRKIMPPQPLKRFNLLHQQTMEQAKKASIKSQVHNSSLNELVERFQHDAKRIRESAFSEPKNRDLRAEKKFNSGIMRQKGKKKTILKKQKTIQEYLEENGDFESNPDRNTPNLFKRVLKNFPDNEAKANKVLQQLLNRKQRQKEREQTEENEEFDK